ncbi:MAG: phage tail protein [Candidatus Dormibacteria bacterium]
MAVRDDPYGAFNFIVNLDTGGAGMDAGFSDVSGLGNEVKFSEYRNGSDLQNHVRKIPNVNSTDDVTLKRGLIGDPVALFGWLKSTREGDIDKRTVTITLLDERRTAVCQWVLEAAQPKKWVGPSLTAKGGGEVAMEELHLVAESVEFKPTP